MRTTNIAESSLDGGILVFTDADPTPEELTTAVAKFHEYPIIRDTAMVCLLDPSRLTPQERAQLRAVGIPGYEEPTEK